MREGLTFDDVLLIPKFSEVESRKLVSTETKFSKRITLRNPIVSACMDTVTESAMALALAEHGGIGIIHRYMSAADEAQEVITVKSEMPEAQVAAAIGIQDEDIDRAHALFAAGASALVVDVAHAHASRVLKFVEKIKNLFSSNHVDIIVGNVATYEGARDLAKAGADGIRIGIGNGSICTTRLVAGTGVPQLTALMDCARITKEFGVPIISDGGARKAGDIVKALAAGASTVMLGRLLAGTIEAANPEGTDGRTKVYRGMASLGAVMTRNRRTGMAKIPMAAEGVGGVIEVHGDVGNVVSELVGGLCSGMSYSGAKTIQEFWEKAEFIRMTSAGLKESSVHAF